MLKTLQRFPISELQTNSLHGSTTLHPFISHASSPASLPSSRHQLTTYLLFLKCMRPAPPVPLARNPLPPGIQVVTFGPFKSVLKYHLAMRPILLMLLKLQPVLHTPVQYLTLILQSFFFETALSNFNILYHLFTDYVSFLSPVVKWNIYKGKDLCVCISSP